MNLIFEQACHLTVVKVSFSSLSTLFCSYWQTAFFVLIWPHLSWVILILMLNQTKTLFLLLPGSILDWSSGSLSIQICVFYFSVLFELKAYRYYSLFFFQFFLKLGNQCNKPRLLKMKSVTKTLQAPSPTSTKASAWPDPSFFSPQKNNHIKNLGSTSGLLSHVATPYTPPSIDTHPRSAGWV